MRTNPTHALVWTISLGGCFGEAAPSDGSADGGTAADSGSGDATSMPAEDGEPSGSASVGSASTTNASADSGSSSADATTGPADDTVGSDAAESSSTGDGGMSTFCDDPPADVVLCRDFDGNDPLGGMFVSETNGEVTTTKDRVWSPPRAMQATTELDFAESASATAGQAVLLAPLPFEGRFTARVWIDAACSDSNVERFVMSMSFFDVNNIINYTLWITPTSTILYSSVAPEGFPSTPHPIATVLPTDTWIELAIELAASSPDATVYVDNDAYPVQLETWTADIATAIADVPPAITVGTAVGPGNAPCTMYFDDVLVTGM